MEISVVLCTYNREKYLPYVLDSIIKQTLDTSKFEVILINNNSPGNTKEIAENFKINFPEIDFLYFEEYAQGLSFARNLGIKKAKYELITFIDDDAFLKEDFLEKTIKAFYYSNKIIAIGGKILLSYETIIPNWENKYLNSLLGYFNPSETSFNFDSSNYPRGSNMTFKRVIFSEIGGFNTSLGRIGSSLIGGEEKELFDRIYRLKKYEIKYIPDAIVFHTVPESRTTKEFIKKQALGTGVSERIRTKNESQVAFLSRLLVELVKWFGSIVLFFKFLINKKIEKGYMLLFFRFWVSVGLLKKS
jgi:glycosyltransferase involved in cell wall biosynthesis